MRRTVSLVAAVGVMLVCSALTYAVGVDVKYTGIEPYEDVRLSHPYIGTSPFRAGVYKIMIQVPGEGEVRWDTFCIDLKQEVSGEYHEYEIELVDNAPQDGGSAWTPMKFAKADDVEELWHEHFAEVTDATTAAAFQVALWEIIYENASDGPPVNPYDVSAGNLVMLTGTPDAVIDQANAWLATIDDDFEMDPFIELKALTHYTSETNWQDYLYDADPRVEIPEPVTVASVLLGVCGLGSYIRRRVVV